MPHYEKAATEEARNLLLEGAVALAEVESNGMCVDVPYLQEAIKKTKLQIKEQEAELATSEISKEWKRAFGGRTNFDSSTQLGEVLFDILKFPCPETTKTGRHKTDEKAISQIDHPFIRSYLRIKKLKKTIGTNLKGVLEEVVDGKIHCFFNLNTVQTYRSSSESFNFQNVPVRDKETAALVRKAFVARPGRQIVEIDISGAEVRISACYNKDPKLIEYICDPTKDMHRDLAMECFQLPQEEVNKDIRYCGKNMFVFPQFYGDWYKDCARNLWAAIEKMKLTTVSGISVRQHLNDLGIHDLGDLDPKESPAQGTFEEHIQSVEKHFWEERFPTYARWKKTWFEDYQRRGWLQMLTGFVCRGMMERNQIINYPVQGTAFHCLLWSLIRLVRHEMKKRRMDTLIVGQIHDSMVADAVPEELEDFLRLCKRVMTQKLPRHWPWLIVPMDIEAEAAPVGGSWADKKKMEIPE